MRFTFSCTPAPIALTALALATSASAQVAVHTEYGTSCYDVSSFRAVYQEFDTAVESQMALEGRAITFTPSGPGYLVEQSTQPYVSPSASAISLPLIDDDEINLIPTQPFPHVGGPVNVLSVCSNGFINMGPAGFNSTIAYGTVSSLLSAPVASFRSNTDLDPTSGGDVWFEEVAGVMLVTFEDVRRWNSPGVERFQFQLDLNTGVVTIVWNEMTIIGAAPMIVGYSAGAPSMDSGGIDLATDLPYQTGPDLQLDAISLQASPPPISTSNAGTLVTYTMNDVPDAWVDSGLRFGVVIVSFTANVPGVDLDVFGAPGCFLHVGALDVLLDFVDINDNSTITRQFMLPAGVTPGTEIYSQAAALLVPNSLPNGLNQLGATTSNGVRSLISSQ